MVDATWAAWSWTHRCAARVSELASFTKLMEMGRESMGLHNFSLYVLADNKPARRCYEGLGFALDVQPEDDPVLENVIFMTASS